FGAGRKNCSEADFALGCKLAFCTNGDLVQMHRLFMQSALGQRQKCRTLRGSIDYVEYTLRKCLAVQKAFWKPRAKAIRSNRRGRKLSETSVRVLNLRRKSPNIRACDTARMLDLKPATVRQILARHSVGGKEEPLVPVTSSLEPISVANTV